MKYSVIDVSSSSISMVVAANGGTNEILFKERAALSLTHYFEGDKLSARGMEKLAALLDHMKAVAAAEGAQRCYVISTAALRHVANSEQIAGFVREKTGLAINFIDEPTEAYCDYIANLSYRAYDRAVLIDLGGKSIEICDLSKSEKAEMFGLEFGLVDLTRKFVGNIYPTEDEVKSIRKYLNKKFDGAGVPGEGKFATAVLVGAAATAVYDIYADFAKVQPAESKVIEYKKYKKLVRRLLEGADRSRLILKNAPEKVYVIGAAVVALKAIFKRFGVERILVSESGVKEGYLRLVLDGREEGEYALLDAPERSGREAPSEVSDVTLVAESAPVGVAREPAGQPDSSAESPEGTLPAGNASAEAPVAKRRGRPKKTAQGTQQSDKKPAATAAAKKPAVKKPAKRTAAGKAAAKTAAEQMSQTQSAGNEASAPKRRGRPKKNI